MGILTQLCILHVYDHCSRVLFYVCLITTWIINEVLNWNVKVVPFNFAFKNIIRGHVIIIIQPIILLEVM